MVETTARFRVSPDIVARDVADGLMLVNIQTGSAFKLNQVGAAVWKQLDGMHDVGAIVAELDGHYRVGGETLLRDVRALLDDLRSQGLVSLADPR